MWVGADPTNRRLAGETHVKIGHGRHYVDVPPIKGIDVTAGMASYADVVFTLGDVTPIETTWGDTREGEIRSFTAKVPRMATFVSAPVCWSRIRVMNRISSSPAPSA